MDDARSLPDPLAVPPAPSLAPGMEAQSEQLISQARGGSSAAQNALVRHFEPIVAHYLRQCVGPRLARYLAIEDLTQEVLVRGVNGLNHLRTHAQLGDLQALLFRHAQWVVAQRGREAGGFVGETAHGRVPTEEPAESLGGAGELSSTGPVTREDRANWIRSLLARLDKKYASALELYLEGRSYPEIAAALSIEEAAARKRVLRGAKLLHPLTGRLGSNDTRPPR